jgi:hypothetical protein
MELTLSNNDSALEIIEEVPSDGQEVILPDVFNPMATDLDPSLASSTPLQLERPRSTSLSFVFPDSYNKKPTEEREGMEAADKSTEAAENQIGKR